jgi:phosphatidylinositol-3-phosphatase
VRVVRWTSLTAVALLALGLVSACGSAASDPEPMADGGRPVAHPARVAVIVLENRSYEEVIGSPSAPYINRLARTNALATNYYAITHPSLPNYIALTGGAEMGITNDCATCDVAGDKNIVGQLDRSGHTWKAYFEGIDSNRQPGETTQKYNPHYNPFVYYESVRGVDQNRDRVVGFHDLHDDLKTGRVSDLMWIAPGVKHDGHNSTLHAADRYASSLVPRVLQAIGPQGVLYLTWDEGKTSDTRGLGGAGGGRIPLIAAGGAARTHTLMALPANHYALLRTVEAGFGLRALRNAGQPSTPVLRGLLEPHAGG